MHGHLLRRTGKSKSPPKRRIKSKPAWDATIHDLPSMYKMSKSDRDRKFGDRTSKHAAEAQHEVEERQRQLSGIGLSRPRRDCSDSDEENIPPSSRRLTDDSPDPEDVAAVSAAILKLGDRHHNNGRLCMVEVSTFLTGTPYYSFAEWFTRSRLVKFDADHDGSVDRTELEAAVHDYLSENLRKAAGSPHTPDDREAAKVSWQTPGDQVKANNMDISTFATYDLTKLAHTVQELGLQTDDSTPPMDSWSRLTDAIEADQHGHLRGQRHANAMHHETEYSAQVLQELLSSGKVEGVTAKLMQALRLALVHAADTQARLQHEAAARRQLEQQLSAVNSRFSALEETVAQLQKHQSTSTNRIEKQQTEQQQELSTFSTDLKALWESRRFASVAHRMELSHSLDAVGNQSEQVSFSRPSDNLGSIDMSHLAMGTHHQRRVSNPVVVQRTSATIVNDHVAPIVGSVLVNEPDVVVRKSEADMLALARQRMDDRLETGSVSDNRLETANRGSPVNTHVNSTSSNVSTADDSMFISGYTMQSFD